MGSRHLARRLALQALYGLDANPEQGQETAVEAARGEHSSGDDDTEADLDLMRELVVGTWSRRTEIDAAIKSASRNWKLGRMDRVDRSVMRLAVFEMIQMREIPAPVILSEAIELAKEFGAPDSPAFVNGILDKIARELRADEVKER